MKTHVLLLLELDSQYLAHNERRAQRSSMDGDLVGPHCAQKKCVVHKLEESIIFWD